MSATRSRRLEGRVAIVSGAGSRGPGVGNGKATSILFARHGARVVLADLFLERAEETRRRILEEGGEAIAVGADLSDLSGCEAVVKASLEQYGGVNILFNNVGISGPTGTAVDLDPMAWDQLMRINVGSQMLMARVCIPEMVRAGGGSIINMASVAGLTGGHPSLAYPTSKGAIVNMTRAMAVHHGLQGIRVNCIAPGTVYTPMVFGRMTPELRAARRARTLLQTEGTSWDVGMAAVFLASDEARWISGLILPVDGGATAGKLDSGSPRSDGT